MTDQIAIECYGKTRGRRRAELFARVGTGTGRHGGQAHHGGQAPIGRLAVPGERDDRYCLDQGGTTPVMRA
jgi:hypothetical protein